MPDQAQQPQQKPLVHEAKPDPMANRAPAHTTRPVEEKPDSGIELMPPNYRPNFFGQKLDHTLYVDPHPDLDYKFCTSRTQFGQVGVNQSRGWKKVTDKFGGQILDPDAHEVNVAGMTLCARHKGYGEVERQVKRDNTLIQARKHKPAEVGARIAQDLQISERSIFGQENTTVTTEMLPKKQRGVSTDL